MDAGSVQQHCAAGLQYECFRSRLSSFLSPAAPPGFGLCTLCRVTAPLGNAGKAGLSSATSSSISPPRHPVLCRGVVGRFPWPGMPPPLPPAEAPLQEESASACPAVDLGCRLRNSAPAVCPDRGMKAEGAAVQRRPLRASLIMEAVY